MSELRAPDPTLWANRNSAGSPRFVAFEEFLFGPPIAHHSTDGPVDVRAPQASCNGAVLDFEMPSDAAAYIAVPCRECFPDAPPPGWRHAISGFRHDDSLANDEGHICDPGLAWQVQL